VTLSVFNVTKKESFHFAPEQVAAALIYYCRQRRIPLPRAGKKSLEIRGDNLCLKILLNIDYTPLVKPMATTNAA
jgi:hypothetical protein